MTTQRQCQQCGAEIPANFYGVCPKCLIQQGFESHDAAPAGDQGIDPTASHSGFVAPSPEELAEWLADVRRVTFDLIWVSNG